MTERKTFTVRPETKQGGEPGTVVCRFATLNVVDSDGDVTLPGAFGEQTVRMQPHGHDTWALPIGKGAIREEGDDAIAELLINLELGQDHYSALKFDMEHGDPQIEWSYTFDILEEESGEFEGQKVRFLKSLKVHSVDSVFLGAGVGTGTLLVKNKKCRNCDEAVEALDEHAKEEDGQIVYSCVQPSTSFEQGHEKAVASLCEVAGFISRAGELVASLREKGEQVTTVKREALASVLATLKQSHDDLDALLKEPEEKAPATPRAAIVLRLSELEHAQRQLAEV